MHDSLIFGHLAAGLEGIIFGCLCEPEQRVFASLLLLKAELHTHKAQLIF